MSTPDELSQPLTRRQLRELKLTGQTPVISAEEIEAARAARDAEDGRATGDAEVGSPEDAEVVEAAVVEPAPAESSAAQPTVAGDVVEADVVEEPTAERPEVVAAQVEEVAALDAAARESSAPSVPTDGSRPLTRREVREQERIRTAQFSVVPPDEAEPAGVESAHETEPAAPESAEAESAAAQSAERESGEDEPNLAAIETKIVGENETSVLYEVVEVPFEHAAAQAEESESQAQEPVPFERELPVAHLVYEDTAEPASAEPRPDEEFAESRVETVYVPEDAPVADEPDQRPTVAPAFGASLLKEPAAEQPASFEEILSHSNDSSGTSTAASALILAADPGSIPLSAPIDATGEILITSTHALPDGFGSRGHAAGTTDGKEVDVVLIDGELPLASSPTPIAASDAVSTSKSPAEVIRPPAPEKTHRLTLILGIAAGVLGVALIGVVVAAFMNGLLG
ncbi:hypothetical protein [Microbacterium sp.]|uniref:hypothetical protein n=1 Tax=Microbacterium sp. TaxID=51671 RepID=UPI0028118E0D|nr:hypothetical protein [Microbacterium sp.]